MYMTRLLAIIFCLYIGSVRADVQTLLQLVDYMGVDYAEAVENGAVIDEFEYAEMAEFSGRIQTETNQLEPTAATVELSSLSQQLTAAVTAKVDPPVIAGLTQSIRELLMSNYNIALTPSGVPDLARGRQLFTENCVSCHGESGRGDGAAAVGMEPAPTNFVDKERARQRSLFSLFNTITLGVAGTPMPARLDMADKDRWALAFYVGGLFMDELSLQAGATAWAQTPLTLSDAVTLSPAELAATYSQGEILGGWARHHPEALFSGKMDPLQYSRESLASSLQLYRDGRVTEARDAAVTAYLEGFELIEAPLSNIDSGLMMRTEGALMVYRNAIAQRVSQAQLQTRYDEAIVLLDESAAALSGASLSPSVAFSGSLIILLREGLEIILVLAAIITFLVKSGRNDALKYVYAGCVIALLVGAGTWAVSAYVFTISGATREMTEGYTALFAAAILLYVGFWMHRNASAKAWNKYLNSKVKTALDARTLWTLALVSFLAVYREIFEIILFYQALWAQANTESHNAVFFGAGLALVLLALTTWVIFKFGMQLPLKQFFTASAVLMVTLAFVFTGKGIAALQEAGTLSISPISGPKIELLGIYPNAQTLTMQALVVLLVVVAIVYEKLQQRNAPSYFAGKDNDVEAPGNEQ